MALALTWRMSKHSANAIASMPKMHRIHFALRMFPVASALRLGERALDAGGRLVFDLAFGAGRFFATAMALFPSTGDKT